MKTRDDPCAGPPCPATQGDVTRLLQAWRQGDHAAMDALMPLVYDELHRLARHYMRHERRDHTLQPTALIHEAWLRLVEQRELDWESRAHFVAVASTMMRRVLMNHARARLTAKRGSGGPLVSLENVPGLAGRQPAELLLLDEALTGLTGIDPRLSRVVELRLFGGFTVAETARYLGVSNVTVKRDWRLARAWLRQRLDDGPCPRHDVGAAR